MQESGHSSEQIKAVLKSLNPKDLRSPTVTEEEAQDNRVFWLACLASFDFFTHEAVNLEDPKIFLAFIQFLSLLPKQIIGKVLTELPDLQPYIRYSVDIPVSFSPLPAPKRNN